MYRRIFSGLLAVVAVSVLLTGCDSFLQKQPQGELNTENYFRNGSDARKAINATYDYAQMRSVNYLAPYPMVFGAIASDNSVKGGEGGSDQPHVDRVDTFTPRANDPLISSTWNTLYTGVFRANLAIENIPDIESMDPGVREQLVGEAKFLRAYFHFYLLQMYGLGDGRANDGPGIPVLTEPLPASEADVPRSPEPEVWTQIEKDLKDAASAMSPTAPDLGRATSGAAKALRVKAHIFQEEWPTAQTLAEEIIGSYRLAPDYSRIFTEEGEFGPGSVFEINHETLSNALEGTVGTTYQNPRSSGGYGWNCPTQDLFNAFADDDPRRDATILTDGETVSDPQGNTETVDVIGACSAVGTEGGYLNQKRWRAPGQRGSARKGATNLRVIRYAHVLLWHAEAANENDNPNVALTSLNKVRQRARDDDDNPSNDPSGVLPDITTTDKEQLRQAIWHEQRVEFAMESHRFFNLVRQDRAADVLGNKGFDEGTNERFPIPAGHLDQSQAVEQNEGY